MKDKFENLLKNKQLRYKIGFLSFLFFFLFQLASNIYYGYDPNYYQVPYSSTYISISCMSLMFFVLLIKEKIAPSNSQMKQIYFFYTNYFYFYQRRRNRTLALRDFEDHEINTEEKFKKNVHQMAILLMILFYISISFKLKSMNNLTIKSENSIFIITSLITVLLLRKFLLKNNDIVSMNIWAFISCVIGIIFIFVFQVGIYLSGESFLNCFIYASLGGIIMGFFVCLLKYYQSKYESHFNLFLLYSLIGLYCLILIPFFLFLLFLFEIETGDIFEVKSYFFFALTTIGNGVIRNLLAFYSIIYLSPLVFIFGLTLTVPASIGFDFIKFEVNWDNKYFYFGGCVLLTLGFTVLIIDKYRKLRQRFKREYSEIFIENHEESMIIDEKSEYNYDRIK